MDFQYRWLMGDPTSSDMTERPAYRFGIRDNCLFNIPPLLYFLSKGVEGLLISYNGSAPLLSSTDPNTCSLTEHAERILITNDRHQTDQLQAILAFVFVTALCFALRQEAKWNRSSHKARWAYDLDFYKDIHYPPETRTLAPLMVASHGDYRMVLHSEATRLLCSVAVVIGLCPIAEYFFCAREMVTERLFNHLEGSTHGVLMNGLFMVYLVFRYSTLPCLLTAFLSEAVMYNVFSWGDRAEHSALNVWDRWIQRWIEAHERENKEKEDRYMTVMKDMKPYFLGSEELFYHFPELRVDPTSWVWKYKGFGSEPVRRRVGREVPLSVVWAEPVLGI